MRNFILFSLLLTLFFSCNGNKSGSENKNNTPKKNNEIQISYPADAVIPEGIYATNTATPLKKFNVTNVIDGDNSTIWKTPLGAGTDEGIMFYFSKPEYIGSIKLNLAEGEEFSNIESFIIYCDGVTLMYKDSDNKKFNINRAVSALYIRLGKSSDKQLKVYNESDEYEESSTSIEQEFYPKNKCIGISEIDFFNEDGTKINIMSPILINCEITASSTLKPENGYTPDNLVDNKKEFAWAEGAEGKGISEWVSFNFEKEVTITELKIWNGYQRSESHFKKNARAKALTFSTSENNSTDINLSDIEGSQIIKLDKALTGKKFKLEINDIYPGEKYPDLVISEIIFFNNNIPLKAVTTNEEERISDSKQIQSKQLKNILDRLIKTNENYTGIDIDENKSKSLIIRSNNSFVYYTDNNMYDEYDVETEKQKTIIAEGGWELVEENTNSARIRIFGKMYESSFKNSIYKGKSERTSTNIFQDYITITDSNIVGKSFVENINLLW